MTSTTTITAGCLNLILDERGYLKSLKDLKQGKDYLYRPAPLLRVAVCGKVEDPQALSISDENLLTLTYQCDLQVQVEFAVKSKHVTFNITSVSSPEVETVMWGPYPLAIAESVGETVGVLRDSKFAVGLQGLNKKTLAGWPREHSSPEFDDYSWEDARTGYYDSVGYRTAWGAVLQVYTRNRTRPYTEAALDVDQAVAPPFSGQDARLSGSKIALFGCPREDALGVIEEIEKEEGLPRHELEGCWAKVSRKATIPYLITAFTEENLDTVLDYAQKAGFEYVYHPGPFDTWGHFKLNPEGFTGGDESMAACVEKAGKRGIKLGVHTLSNFITTNDPYVTPEPDPRLKRVGTSRLAADIGPQDKEIPVASKVPFTYRQHLSTAVLGGELIQYSAIEGEDPAVLKGCVRGAFGTKASAHSEGDEIGKLWDHSYRVFFSDLDLQDDLTQRLVELFNNTGLRQISFDGLEGCRATGHGTYAENLFVQQCFDGWEEDVISDASQLTHFTWHMHTRMNWGEPWGAAMREGMPEYRFRNQRYFKRNLFPRMLGWFLMRLASDDFPATTLDDIEWFLAKAAGFKSGFALVCDPQTLENHGQTSRFFESIKLWEEARMAGLFTKEQRALLKDPEVDWHLERERDGSLTLWPVSFSKVFTCNPQELQPGQPGGADWPFRNPHGTQPLCFRMQAVARSLRGGQVVDPSFTVNGSLVQFKAEIPAFHYLVYEGGREGLVYDENWNMVKEAAVIGEPPLLTEGDQSISMSCTFAGASKPRVEVRFITRGEKIEIEE